ncbi:MAG: HAD family phosphatase [Chlamydiia bacterium]|nr:HAD family phosphatase [Chlamydiia bacterium]
MDNKGWIALDIDGTITREKYSIPKEVTTFLRKCEQEGWRIAIATGRSFHFALLALSEFEFPFVLLPQNGSMALVMPERRVLFRRYLAWDALALIEEAFEGVKNDFVVYMGWEKKDQCYFRPHRFSKAFWPYLQAWQVRQREEWQPVEEFTEALIPAFPLVKSFGSFEEMGWVAKRLKKMGRFQTAVLRDPFDESHAVLLITDIHASKGLSLEEVFRLKGRGALVIAAGDDDNDVSLLRVADIKIAMSHSPDFLKNIADFIALSTKPRGIIEAISKAIEHGK